MTLFTTSITNCTLTPGTDESDTGYFFSFPACANAPDLTSVNKYVFMIHGFESDIEEWSNEAKDELLIAEPADTIGIVIVNWEEGAKHDIFRSINIFQYRTPILLSQSFKTRLIHPAPPPCMLRLLPTPGTSAWQWLG